jgi:NAD(P)H dehydrogenase (quinone)
MKTPAFLYSAFGGKKPAVSDDYNDVILIRVLQLLIVESTSFAGTLSRSRNFRKLTRLPPWVIIDNDRGGNPMPKALVCYYSRTGNTKKMAARIAEVLESQGLEVDLKTTANTAPADLLGYDCIVLGSPTYYGGMAWEMKKLLDESVKFHGKLRGKVGGAFTSSANIGGGNETTVLDILHALLIHGMIIRGDHRFDHYGPVSIGRPDKRALDCCEAHAKNLAALTKKLFS